MCIVILFLSFQCLAMAGDPGERLQREKIEHMAPRFQEIDKVMSANGFMRTTTVSYPQAVSADFQEWTTYVFRDPHFESDHVIVGFDKDGELKVSIWHIPCLCERSYVSRKIITGIEAILIKSGVGKQ